MPLSKRLRPLLLLAILAAAAQRAAPVWGAPLAQDNLLTNAGFEAGTLTGWQGWWTTTPGSSGGTVCDDLGAPAYGVNSAAARSGGYAAHYFTRYTSHLAGLYQAVPNVTPGAVYRLTAAGQATSHGEGETTSGSNTRMWIGIDPLGGTNAFAESVVWSAQQTPMDAYSTFSVEAPAEAEQITVFLRSRPDWCVAENDVYWDDVALVRTGQTVATQPPGTQATAPAATQGPTATRVLATADANGRIVHTVQADDTLSSIAFAYGVPVDEIRRLNDIPADSELILLGSRLVIRDGNATPTPTPEPTAEPTATDLAPEDTSIPEAEPTLVAEVTDEPDGEPAVEPEAAAPGSVCVMSYNDANGNALRDNSEDRQPGVTFVLDDGEEIVGRYTTDGLNEPYCFTELMPGVYSVRWEDDAFTATTSQEWQISLNAGDIMEHEFGVRPVDAPETAGEEPATLVDRSPAWVLALGGALGVMVMLAAIGAGLYFGLVRPRTEVDVE